MHMIINKYLVDGKNYFSFINNLKGELICLEVKFICIPNKLTADIEKILQNYHIKINQYMNENYIKSFIDDKDTELSLMAYKIQRGYNKNEVLFVPKTSKKKGFFEKFFLLFS